MEHAEYLQMLAELKGADAFGEAAIHLFRLQAEHNPMYKNYLKALKIAPERVDQWKKIPFLPVELWKSGSIMTGDFRPEEVFSSSSTTGTGRSLHPVRSLEFYHGVCRHSFERFYGPLQAFEVLALLPSYLERNGSSLVEMASWFMKCSGQSEEGFFLYDHTALLERAWQAQRQGRKVLLLGVTYALLDLADGDVRLPPHTVVMETGGMKGRRREMIREEVHTMLQSGLGVASIHSEYGMTEMLSQAYALENGLFCCPPWVKVAGRDLTDPLQLGGEGRNVALNIIDLANVDSCAFIATQDVGVVHANGTFEVKGRFDHAEVRGCNLLVAG
jgi:hypothetical protein